MSGVQYSFMASLKEWTFESYFLLVSWLRYIENIVRVWERSKPQGPPRSLILDSNPFSGPLRHLSTCKYFYRRWFSKICCSNHPKGAPSHPVRCDRLVLLLFFTVTGTNYSPSTCVMWPWPGDSRNYAGGLIHRWSLYYWLTVPLFSETPNCVLKWYYT